MLLQEILKRIQPLDAGAMAKAKARSDQLALPKDSLGRLQVIARQIAGITGRINPPYEKKVILTMAGDHGVVEEGVSAFPQEVTPQMVYNFVRGRAGVNVLARHVGAEVIVVDMGVAADMTDLVESSRIISKKVDYGTKNFTKGPAMNYEQAVQSLESGIEIVNNLTKTGLDILGVGDMGIGNTTPSSAIAAVFTGRKVEEVTGRGTGIDDETLKRKIEAIKSGLALNQPDPAKPVDVLAKVGGFEIGGIAGAILGAAALRVPVVIDGLIAGAGALIATELSPTVKEYIFAGHRSVEQGHKIMLERMGLRPLLDLDFRLGEGTGAALGISLLEASIKILNQIATFEEAGVSEG
ncbi:MAG: nicotinate-nucleotide--dimethylbenzimidazole phosphoribosyltransferase [bacterium]|nr:nicotinate-nucleotide--dimethylbenzimidazole phosphoribosyltransferase [bacterium]